MICEDDDFDDVEDLDYPLGVWEPREDCVDWDHYDGDLR